MYNNSIALNAPPERHQGQHLRQFTLFATTSTVAHLSLGRVRSWTRPWP